MRGSFLNFVEFPNISNSVIGGELGTCDLVSWWTKGDILLVNAFLLSIITNMTHRGITRILTSLYLNQLSLE